MATREQSLNLFLTKADEVIAGKYLFATKKIEEMLMTISSSKILFEVFEHCCNGEDGEGLLAKYLPLNRADGEYKMPENPKQAVAMCFYALNGIASGNTDFNTFLITRYPDGESFLDSYALFVNNMVVPFRNTVKMIVESIISAKKVTAGRRQEHAPQTRNLDTLYLLGLVAFLEEDRRAVVNSPLKDDVAKDLLCVLDSFIEYAKQGRTDMIKPIYVGYKYACMHAKKIRTHASDVEELLIDHGIIE